MTTKDPGPLLKISFSGYDFLYVKFTVSTLDTNAGKKDMKVLLESCGEYIFIKVQCVLNDYLLNIRTECLKNVLMANCTTTSLLGIFSPVYGVRRLD